jgi:hypothetical protein
VVQSRYLRKRYTNYDSCNCEYQIWYDHYCVLKSYSSYNFVPLDPDEQENTTLTFAFGVVANCCMPFGSCDAPAIESLAKDYKLNACRRQPFVTFSSVLSLDMVLFVFVFVFVVFFRTCALYSSLGERSPTLH